MAQTHRISQPFSRFDTHQPESYREGELTQRIEQQTARIPSGSFLALAFGSMAVSAGLAFYAKKRDLANFIGLWAPSLLLMGIYNKLVKQEGSDMTQHPRELRAS